MAALATSAALVAPAALTSSLKASPVVKPAQLSVTNGSRVSCMKVWNPINNPKFETLSYLPAMTDAIIAKQISYMLQNGWVPCLEFDASGVVYRENNSGPGYYDGRYWTMWKLPLFGCTDASQVLRELQECKNAFPQCYIRILGFDNIKQVQCTSFIAYKP